jgi:triosephosphate isomerase (TIM)
VRKPLVVANWKMNGDFASNESLYTALRSGMDTSVGKAVEIVICPPFPYLGHSSAWLTDTKIKLGAQNIAATRNGAFTGEVSASMLSDVGCQVVIIGHSERRSLYGETDALVAQKLSLALAAQLTSIICVGETLQENEAGMTEAVLAKQLDAVAAIVAQAPAIMCVIAYEPVWAIGTGRSASPEQAQAVHRFIRAYLSSKGVTQVDEIRILYGGSVKPSNILSLMSMPDIDGALVGGASLVADEFLGICRAAAVA